MPDNKFSSSVDEILETLKQQQAAAPASDRAVDEILAGLGLGDGLPLPPVQQAPAPQADDAPKARPAAKIAEEKPAPARPAPQQQARPAQPAKAQPARKAEAARPAPKAQPAQKQETPRQEAPAEKPARRTVQRPAAKPAEAKAPAAESEADEVIRQVQQTVTGPAAPSPDAMQQLTGTISETMQFDAEFQKFFSESVAVIPDEEPEQHPGFFARFLRHKDDGAGFEEDDELSETGEVKVDEPTLMIPNPARAPQPQEIGRAHV